MEAVRHKAADHGTQFAPTLGQVVGGVASGDIASGASDQIVGGQLSETFAQDVGACPGQHSLQLRVAFRSIHEGQNDV